MPFIASAREHNRAVIETEIRIPWNSVVENNPVIYGDVCAQNAVETDKKKEQ